MKYQNLTSIFLFYSAFFLLIANCLLPIASFAQATTWQSLINNTSNYTQGIDAEMAIATTSDSGVVVIKNSSVYPGPSHIALLKMDKRGSLEWSKDLGKLKHGGSAGKIIQTADKGFLIIGGNEGDIIKTDFSGKILWTKAYGKTDLPPPALGEFCQFNDIKETKDGGYILTGETSNFGTRIPGYSYNMQSTDVYLVKIDTAGVVKWAKTYGRATLLEYGTSVEQTPDGGYIVAGKEEEPNSGQWVENAAFLLKVDSIGTLKWAKTYGTLSPYYISHITGVGEISGDFTSVIPTADGGYLATGRTGYSYGAWVVKTDSLGAVKWTKEYGNKENNGCGMWGVKLYQPSARQYTLQTQLGSAFYNGPCGNNQDIFLFNLDTSGNINWLRSYGTTEENSTSSDMTKEKGYAICSYVFDTAFAGYQNGFGNGYKGGFSHIYKVDSLGKNGFCQNTLVGVYTIPTLATAKYAVKVNTGTMTTDNIMTASTYTIVIDNAICFNAPVEASFSADLTCLGDSTHFNNYSRAGLYNWNFGEPASGANTSIQENPRHLYSSIGTYTVTLIAKDGDGLNPDTISKVLEIVSNKFVSIGTDITLCSGDSVQLRADGNWTWFGGWLPTDSLRDPVNDTTYAHPGTTTQYKVMAYNGGCYDYDSLTVTVVPNPIPSIQGNSTVCQGINSTLSAVGAGNYLWSTGETGTSITISPDVSAAYSITAYTGSCMGTASIPIVVTPNYTVNAGNNVTIINGASVVLAATTSAGAVTWLPLEGLDCVTCPNPTAKPVTTTTYFVTTQALSECTGIDSVTVYVINCADIFVPTAFSPNDDGVNDVLFLKNDCIRELDFKIYDRWGNKVFETDKVNEGWDGMYKGKEMNSGMFVYYFNATLFSGDPVSRKGNISLIR